MTEPLPHRDVPWPTQGAPLPSAPMMHQWWRDITFVHWAVDPDLVAPHLPRGTRPDLHDGAAWVGLIPFHMVGAGLGRRRAVPHLGTFLETNVRLYSVDDAGRHGVVFASLEAERLAVVLGAVGVVRVPYKWARMSRTPARPLDPVAGARLTYATTRRTPSAPRSTLTVEVGAEVAAPAPLDVFLTARFGLHTRILGRTWWIPNTHGPWPLRHARLVDLDDQLVAAAGFPGVVDHEPGSVLFSTGVRTLFGRPALVR